MAKWDAMVEAAAKLRGALASAQEVVRQLQQKITDLQASGMNDEEDQKKVDEFAAEFNAIADQLPGAIASNPQEPEPGTESTGGAQ